jgi:hypothetical protein
LRLGAPDADFKSLLDSLMPAATKD